MQLVDDTLRLSIVIVDNEAEPNSRRAALAFTAKSPFPAHYVHEPRRGITAARNAAVEKALALQVDWIAFIDDDETAEGDWIAQLMRAQAYFRAEIIHGHVDMAYPDPLPLWAFPKPERIYWAIGTQYAHTGNVLFSTAILQDGLRFDERFALTGGEDSLFFHTAPKRGATIVHVPNAIVTETVPAAKLTFWKQVERVFWIEATNVAIESMLGGNRRMVPRKSVKALGKLFDGIISLTRVPLSRLRGAQPARRRLLKAAKSLSAAAGIIAGMVGHRPQPYLHIVGE